MMPTARPLIAGACFPSQSAPLSDRTSSSAVCAIRALWLRATPEEMMHTSLTETEYREIAEAPTWGKYRLG
jgi:hypothetical protein